MQRCPGQDSRYWTSEDVSEVECSGCGRTVEFFKTDGVRRCPGCGERIINPAVNLGCARWCEHAGECLGFDPKSVQAPAEADKKEAVTGRIIAAVKKELKDDEKRISHAIQVLENAEKILQEEKASPRITLAAALLHDIGVRESEEKYDSAAFRHNRIESASIARRVLKGLDFSEEDIEHVCRIVAHHHSGMPEETPEFRIVWDADRLVSFSDEYPDADEEERASLIGNIFKTAAGRQLAMLRFMS